MLNLFYHNMIVDVMWPNCKQSALYLLCFEVVWIYQIVHDWIICADPLITTRVLLDVIRQPFQPPPRHLLLVEVYTPAVIRQNSTGRAQATILYDTGFLNSVGTFLNKIHTFLKWIWIFLKWPIYKSNSTQTMTEEATIDNILAIIQTLTPTSRASLSDGANASSSLASVWTVKNSIRASYLDFQHQQGYKEKTKGWVQNVLDPTFPRIGQKHSALW